MRIGEMIFLAFMMLGCLFESYNSSLNENNRLKKENSVLIEQLSGYFQTKDELNRLKQDVIVYGYAEAVENASGVIEINLIPPQPEQRPVVLLATMPEQLK